MAACRIRLVSNLSLPCFPQAHIAYPIRRRYAGSGDLRSQPIRGALSVLHWGFHRR